MECIVDLDVGEFLASWKSTDRDIETVGLMCSHIVWMLGVLGLISKIRFRFSPVFG